MTVVVEIENRSASRVDEDAIAGLTREVLGAEGIADGDVGVTLVASDEMRELKRRHLGVDEATDVLSFPIDGADDLPEGLPRQLGDVVLCPDVVGADWRRPLVHGLLHLLGHEHGASMSAVEERWA